VKVAVVGHVEWVEFIRVARVPGAGDIAHGSEGWAEPAGGGGVAVVQLARLAGGETTLFTALGDDELGHRAKDELEKLGVRVEVIFRDGPQRRAVTFVDDAGERTITTIGERLDPAGDDPLPWDELADTDAVYMTAGDAGAIRAARRARALVATSRILDRLQEAKVPLDAVVGSARDQAERFAPAELDPPPSLAVLTGGNSGGTYWTVGGQAGDYPAYPLPGPVVDTYGAGDSFAAGLTFALASGKGVREALAFAARCGATAVTRRGAHGV
jgi:ribokinase